MASSILYVGCSSGGLLLPIIYRVLLDHYGLQGTLWIIAGFHFNITLAGALMRPLSWFSQHSNKLKQQNHTRRNLLVSGKKLPHQEITTYQIKSLTDLKDEKGIVTKSYDRLHQSSRTTHSNIELQHVSIGKRSLSETNVRDCIDYRRRKNEMKINSVLSNSLSDSLIAIYTENVWKEQETNTTADTPIHRTALEIFKSISFAKIFGSIVDKELFCNLFFQIIVACYMMSVPGFALFSTYLPHHLKDIGFSSKNAAMLLSFIGGVDLLNKVGLAVLSDRKFVNRPILVGLSLLVSGGIIIAVPSINDFQSLVGTMVVYGLFFGTFVTLLAVLCIDAVGRDKLSPAFGVMILSAGISISIINFMCGK